VLHSVFAAALEEECLQRLDGAARRSRYMHALLADLRADDEQRAQQGGR
jgi:hypothetical protein